MRVTLFLRLKTHARLNVFWFAIFKLFSGSIVNALDKSRWVTINLLGQRNVYNQVTFLQRLTPRKKTIMGNKGVICNGDKPRIVQDLQKITYNFVYALLTSLISYMYLFTYICVHTCWSSSSFFIYISCKNSIFWWFFS